jgi:hypothetical protein
MRAKISMIAVNMTAYPSVRKPALEAPEPVELEFARDRLIAWAWENRRPTYSAQFGIYIAFDIQKQPERRLSKVGAFVEHGFVAVVPRVERQKSIFFFDQPIFARSNLLRVSVGLQAREHAVRSLHEIIHRRTSSSGTPL